MTVDGSYMAWVRPTRRVHLALSVGMTLTGVILVAAGAFGGRGAVPLSPALGRSADGVVSGGGGMPGVLVPPAPLLPVAPPPAGAAAPSRTPGTAAKQRAKAKPHPRHTAATSPASPTPPTLPAPPPLHPPQR